MYHNKNENYGKLRVWCKKSKMVKRNMKKRYKLRVYLQIMLK